jgi:hypothetical protein
MNASPSSQLGWEAGARAFGSSSESGDPGSLGEGTGFGPINFELNDDREVVDTNEVTQYPGRYASNESHIKFVAGNAISTVSLNLILALTVLAHGMA